MPVFKVLHLTRSDASQDEAYFQASLGSVDKAVENDMYEHVATLECDTLAQLFRLTNSIESAWFDNPEAGALKAPLRSTSVGDIVQMEDGNFLSCQTASWRELSQEHCARLSRLVDLHLQQDDDAPSL